MILLFFIELLFLFFLSKSLTSHLSFLFYRIFRSQKVAIYLMAAIFLIGTIIHEFAHAIMAKALFVYVGKMELMPSLNGETLKLGSVQVGKTDLIRNFLVGIAPFVVGTGLLLLVLLFAFTHDIFGFNFFTFLVLSFTFIIANTMYSSKKDMEGAVEFFLLVVSPILILYFFGVRIPGLSAGVFQERNIQNFFQMIAIFMSVPIILDISFILFAKIVTKR